MSEDVTNWYLCDGCEWDAGDVGGWSEEDGEYVRFRDRCLCAWFPGAPVEVERIVASSADKVPTTCPHMRPRTADVTAEKAMRVHGACRCGVRVASELLEMAGGSIALAVDEYESGRWRI